MKLGMTLEPFKGVTVKKLLLLMHLLSVEHLEINFTMMDYIEGFSKHLDRITTTFHLPIYARCNYDLSSRNNRSNKKVEEIIAFVNKNSESMNLQYVLSHPPEDPEADYDLYLDRISEINAPIVLENIPYQEEEDFVDFYFNTKDRANCKIAGFAFDGPHRYVSKSSGNWLDLSKELINELEYIHVSDCTRTTDLHLPLGLAEFPITEFFQFLKNANYNGIILQEILPTNGSVREVMDSFLICAKEFSKRKYRKLKMKYAFVEPIVQMKINQALKIRNQGIT